MKKTVRNFMFIILAMPSMAFAICNPFTAGPLSASALNNAIASPCITSGTITGAVITNTPISGSTGSFSTLSATSTNGGVGIFSTLSASSNVAISGTLAVSGVISTSTAATTSTQVPQFGQFTASSGSSNVGFLQTGSGAIAETVQNKLNQFIGLNDFNTQNDFNNAFTGLSIPIGINSLVANSNTTSNSQRTSLKNYPLQNGSIWESQYHANWNVVQSQILNNPTEWQIYSNASAGIAQVTIGTNQVTRVSGSLFDSSWISHPYFYFNGIVYKVASVTDNSHLTVQTVGGGAVSWPSTVNGTYYYSVTTTNSVVNVSGTAVTLVSGQPFIPFFDSVFVNGTSYTAVFNSPTSMTLGTNLGSLTNATFAQYANINNELSTLRLQGLAGSDEENFAITYTPNGALIQSLIAGNGQYRPIQIGSGENPIGTLNPQIGIHPNATKGSPGWITLGGDNGSQAVLVNQNSANTNYLILSGSTTNPTIGTNSGRVSFISGPTIGLDYPDLHFRGASPSNTNAWRIISDIHTTVDGGLTFQHSTDAFVSNFTNTIVLSNSGATVNGNFTQTGLYFSTNKTVTSTNSLTTYTVTTQYNYLTGTAGASFAITFPAGTAAIDGQKITIMSTVNRASTTWTSSGATFVGSPSSLTANTPVTFQYDAGTTAWYITQ